MEIFSLSNLTDIVMFNVRGPVTSIVIRFVNINNITVSASGHDACIYGDTAYSKQKYIIGCDILFEYQVKNVVLNDVEYIRVQIWIQNEELELEANASYGGFVAVR